MKYFSLEPEVAGGLGENTIMDSSVNPPVISKLHYEMDGWLGDDLIESFPCFIITKKLRDRLEIISPKGCSFDDVEITKSEQFEDLHPKLILPKFYWLKIHGNSGSDDFGISNDKKLIVSERILRILKEVNIDNCDIEEYMGVQ